MSTESICSWKYTGAVGTGCWLAAVILAAAVALGAAGVMGAGDGVDAATAATAMGVMEAIAPVGGGGTERSVVGCGVPTPLVGCVIGGDGFDARGSAELLDFIRVCENVSASPEGALRRFGVGFMSSGLMGMEDSDICELFAEESLAP